MYFAPSYFTRILKALLVICEFVEKLFQSIIVIII